MKKRKILFRKLLTPVLLSALVLTGITFPGEQLLEAAEMGDMTDGLGEPERVYEETKAIDETDKLENRYDKLEGADEARDAEGSEDGQETGDTEGSDNEDETEDADKTALAEEIKKAEEKNQADYSAASWKNLKTALDAAKEINQNEDATQAQVDEAVKNLKTAVNGLVRIPGRPESVKAVWKGKKKVDITWKKASNATKYLVYRSVKSSSAGFKKIAEVKKTSYTDKSASAGKTAYYKVIAYNGSVKGASSKVSGAYLVKAPSGVKAAASKNTITVSFKKSAKASGYEIWYKTTKKGAYKKAAALNSGKSVKKKFKNMKGGTYFYKVRAYKKSGGKKVYTDFGKEVKVKVQLGSTIENTKSHLTIEADVKLTGSGTGCHAKLVMVTPTSAVSFGIQYDQHAEAPYTGKAMALIENISSNNAGGQKYTRPGNKSLKLNKTYHLMMTVDKNGNGDVYLDYKKIGSFSQPNLKGNVYLRIEAAARLNGDSVDATFSNIKCKWNGKYDPNQVLGKSLTWTEFPGNAGMKYKYNKGKNIQIFGTLSGVNGDWDSDYENVQDVLQFQGPY